MNKDSNVTANVEERYSQAMYFKHMIYIFLAGCIIGIVADQFFLKKSDEVMLAVISLMKEKIPNDHGGCIILVFAIMFFSYKLFVAFISEIKRSENG